MGANRTLLSALLVLTACSAPPLASWNEGESKDALVRFVERAKSVPEAERIAVIDNDGTLWAERPVYFQLYFAMDRIRELAPENPTWKTTQPFQAVLEGDMKALAASGERGLLQLVNASHGNMTSTEFAEMVRAWLKTAKHPTLKRPYKELVYQPMLEVLQYLRANGFRTYICSGGGVEFLRVFAEEVYGIPPEQVIGSTMATRFEIRDGEPVIVREPKIGFVNDKDGKPINIHRILGRRPIAAFGNSDGDLAMIQWTTAGDGPRFGLLVHHTDDKREWKYDRESHIGRLDKALDEARKKGWTVVDMKADWKTIFPAPASR